jgi:hypothetical protein
MLAQRLLATFNHTLKVGCGGVLMKLLVALVPLILVTGIVSVASVAASAEPQVVGGLTPDRRPDGLPRVGATGFTEEGWKRALHGIAEPHPASIDKWLDDQGGWFTPFTHPGMAAPYDIRNLHGASHE